MGGPGSRSGIGGLVKSSLVNQGSEGSRVVKCFCCGERGHISTRCPAKPTLLCRSLSVNKKLCKVGMVGGVCVEGIFLDTGCGQILVRKRVGAQGEIVIGNRGARMCPWGQSVLPIGYGQYGIESKEISGQGRSSR